MKTGVWILLLGIGNVFFFHKVSPVVSVIIQRSFILLSISILYVFVYHEIVRWKWSIKKKLIASSFFIYSIHYPFMLALRKMMVKLFPDASDALSVFFYLSSVVITFFVSYGVYILLRKYLPKVLAVMCRGRC